MDKILYLPYLMVLIFCTSDSLSREPPGDDHLVAVTREKKKSKKMRKLSADRVIDAEPSFGIEVCKENVGTASKDSDKTSGLVMVSEKNVQHATLSGTVVSEKQKHSKPVQEVVEGHKLPSSSMGMFISLYRCLFLSQNSSSNWMI